MMAKMAEKLAYVKGPVEYFPIKAPLDGARTFHPVAFIILRSLDDAPLPLAGAAHRDLLPRVVACPTPVDQDNRLVPNHPGIVSLRESRDVTGHRVEFLAVGHLDVELP